MKKPKLAISNIAWLPGEIDGFLSLISSIGCDGVELAASMLWDEPVQSSARQRLELRRKMAGAGLRLTGLQALLYKRPDLSLFEREGRTLEYLIKVMDLCAELGGRVLTFGSPRNRSRGGIAYDEAYKTALDLFARMGNEAGKRGLFFCIEPLSALETDFINSVAEAERLIKDAGSPPGLGLHVDVKALIETDEVSSPQLVRSFARARHVHLNDPGLMPPGSTGYDHSNISKRLKESGYARFVSIEMRRQEPDAEDAIRKAVQYVRKVYF